MGPIGTGMELSESNCVANSVGYLTMLLQFDALGSPVSIDCIEGVPRDSAQEIPRRCTHVYIQRSYRRTGLYLIM